MFLWLLIITPLLGVFIVSLLNEINVGKYYTLYMKNVALGTSMVNLILSFIVFILAIHTDRQKKRTNHISYRYRHLIALSILKQKIIPKIFFFSGCKATLTKHSREERIRNRSKERNNSKRVVWAHTGRGDDVTVPPIT